MSRKDQDYDDPDWKPYKRRSGCDPFVLAVCVAMGAVYEGLLWLWQAVGGVMQ